MPSELENLVVVYWDGVEHILANAPSPRGSVFFYADKPPAGKTNAFPFREFVSILFPDENIPAETGFAEVLGYWRRCKAKLDSLPSWLLEFLHLALRDSNSRYNPLAAMFGAWKKGKRDREEARERYGDLPGWALGFPGVPQKPVAPRPLPMLCDCTPLEPERVSSYLKEGGALSRLVEGYEPRPGQIAMVEDVARAVSAGMHLAVEAPTGVGKSLGYLLPMALWARTNDVPVVISTKTKNLQSQIFKKELPLVLRMVEKTTAFASPGRLSCAMIKGRQSYVCLRKVGELKDGSFLEEIKEEEKGACAALFFWLLSASDGDLDSFLFRNGGAADFIGRLASSQEECLGGICPYRSKCFLQAARARALTAKIVVANHYVLFSELSMGSPVSLPSHGQVVLDEAHNLEEVATEFLTIEISPARIRLVSKRLAEGARNNAKGLFGRIERSVKAGSIVLPKKEKGAESLGDFLKDGRSNLWVLAKSAERFFKSLGKIAAGKDSPVRFGADAKSPAHLWKEAEECKADLLAWCGVLKESLDSVAQELESDQELDFDGKPPGELAQVRDAIGEVQKLQEDISFVLAAEDGGFVYWVEKSMADMGKAVASPVRVGEFLEKKFFGKFSSVIMCSATLRAGGSFRYFASRTGLDRVDRGRLMLSVAESPFDYNRQCSILAASFMPDPAKPGTEYAKALSRLVASLASHYGGRTLVLFTSYEMMRACAGFAEEALGAARIRLVMQGRDGTRDGITELFKAGRGVVLFGAQSFWEGVDIAGDALSCLVIARLPFSSPTDPICMARKELADIETGNGFQSYSIPEAVIRFRQGFGRLIRRKSDMGSVIIADNRIVKKGYGSTFAKSLPAPLKDCKSIGELLSSLA